MNDQLKNIFDQSPCPDRQTLFDYITGKLSPSKEHSVEEHLLDCAFCSEAIEAYREEKDLSALNDQLMEIDKRIQSGDTEKKQYGFSPQEYLKYAALLALVLISMTGLYFLLSDNKDPDLVIEAPVSKRAPSVQKTESRMNQSPEPAKAVRKTDKSGGLLNATSEQYSDTELFDDLKADVSTQNNEGFADESSVKVSNERTPVAPPTSTQSKTAALKKSKDTEGMRTTREEVDNNKELQATSATTEIDEKATSDELSLSSVKLTSVDPKRSRQVLDSAIKAYDSRFYIQAINILLTFSASDKKEGQKADWYLASAYAETREYEKARPILERLISEGSSYSRKARKLLETF